MKLPATAEALASAFLRHSILQSQGNCRRHCHRNSHLKEESESPSYRRQYRASQQPLYFTPSILNCLPASPVRGKTGKYLSEKSCNKMRSTCPPLHFAVCWSPSTQALLRLFGGPRKHDILLLHLSLFARVLHGQASFLSHAYVRDMQTVCRSTDLSNESSCSWV